MGEMKHNTLILIVASILAIGFIIGLSVVSLEKKSDYITVGGEAQAPIKPDWAVIQVTIQTNAPTADEAQSTNTKTFETLKKALNDKGITSIETSYYYLNEKIDWTSEGSVPKGYEVTNSLRISTSVEKASTAVSIATANGANRIDNVEFQSSRSSENAAVAEAMKLAALSAKEKAKIVVEPLGEKLGKTIKIEESGWYVTQATDNSEDYKIEGYDGNVIQPRRMAVQANVNAAFEIK